MELDETNTKILRSLQEDARLSYRSPARRIRVSTPTAAARVARLESLGIVTGYHAAVDPEGLKRPRLLVVVDCRTGAVDGVGAALARRHEVRWAVRMEGGRSSRKRFFRATKPSSLFFRPFKRSTASPTSITTSLRRDSKTSRAPSSPRTSPRRFPASSAGRWSRRAGQA